MLKHIRLSVLDLAPIVVGGSAAEALNNSLDLARHVEQWGYERFWLAEHHSMPGIASSATAVVIGHIAAGTSKIRVGAGGIMLPNHSPLIVAEQFGTLESLFPGRIDLGLGRAPGSDQATARAVRRGLNQNNEFPELLYELRSYFDPSLNPENRVRAIPGEGLNIPIWLLGSSGYSAQLAGLLGFPFAFASHFAPDFILPALQLYRDHFHPSESLSKPHVMIGMNIIVADTEEEARILATSKEQQFLDMIRGRGGGQLKPPVENMDELWTEHERATVKRQLSYSITGTIATVREMLPKFIERTGADEIIVVSTVYDHKARLRSYELLAEAVASLTSSN